MLHSKIYCWRITTCTRNATNDPIILIVVLFWLLTLLVVSKHIFMKTNNNESCNLKFSKYKILIIIKCRGTLKNKLIKTLSHKISVTERNIAFRRKEGVKTMSKGGYIRIYFASFFGWWCLVGDIFLLVVGGGGWWWWWVVVDMFLLVVGGGGWWWMVVSCGRYIFAGGGWWWMVVDGGGSWRVVA